MQVPAVTKVSASPVVMVHTPGVEDVNTGVNPESEVAVSVGVVPKFCAPGVAKVIVCAAAGVIELGRRDACTCRVVSCHPKCVGHAIGQPHHNNRELAPATDATWAGLTVTV